MDIKNALSKNKTILVIVEGTNYSKSIFKTIQGLKDKKLCYVSLNKTYDALKEDFAKNKVSTQNVLFVDAISKTIKKNPVKDSNVIYCDSPGSITQISLVISKAMKYGFYALFFDSITSLEFYQKGNMANKFVSNLINKFHDLETKGVFFILGSKKNQEAYSKYLSFFDEVVYLKN